jgi:hypothetical protein
MRPFPVSKFGDFLLFPRRRTVRKNFSNRVIIHRRKITHMRDQIFGRDVPRPVRGGEHAEEIWRLGDRHKVDVRRAGLQSGMA